MVRSMPQRKPKRADPRGRSLVSAYTDANGASLKVGDRITHTHPGRDGKPRVGRILAIRNDERHPGGVLDFRDLPTQHTCTVRCSEALYDWAQVDAPGYVSDEKLAGVE